MCKLGAGWVFVGIAGLASVARADFVELSPRALGMGESLRAAATGALAVTQNPAGIALAKTYVLEGDYGYRPDDHTNVEMVTICDSMTARIGACLSYNHLSSDFTTDGTGDRSRHEFSLTLGAPLGDNLAIGSTTRYVSYSEQPPSTGTANNSHDGFLLDLGMTYRLLPTLNIGVAGYNLTGGDDANYSRALGFGMAFNLSSSLLIAADGRYDFGTDNGRYGGGIEYMFSGAEGQQGVPVRAGYVYDALLKASYVTGGIGLMTPRVGIDVGMRKQVDGAGDELMVQASLRLFFPN
jgi:hypothetical protein